MDVCPAGQTAKLRLLATSDLHMNLSSFDYYADRPDPSVGMTRIASLIRAARRSAEGALVVLVDNGDSMQGTPIGDLAAQDTSQRHPLMAAFEALHYDAIGLGNHDFNFGLDTLRRILDDAQCPVVCSNVSAIDGTQLNWRPNIILERTIKANGRDWPIRIGVLSVLPPQTLAWDTHHLRDRVRISDIVSTASETAQGLRRQGCDLVIALAHTGLATGPYLPNAENAAIALAEVADVDALITGHTHLHLPGAAHNGLANVDANAGTIHGKPAIMPGSAGSHLGQIDLNVTSDGQGGWTVTSQHSKLLSISRPASPSTLKSLVDEDPELQQLFRPHHLQTRQGMQEPVGATEHPLHSFFSFFAPDRGLALVAAAQAAALREYQPSTAARELPVLSAAAPSKFGGRAGPLRYTDVPAGVVSMRHVADLHVFPNELSAVIATGKQIREWLEMSASVFNQISPGTSHIPLRNGEHPGHNFDVLHGLTYQVDLTPPARFDLLGTLLNPDHRRIRNLRHHDRPVEDEQKFAVALTNYRANGGGNFAALNDVEPIPVPSHRIQQLVRDYVTNKLPPERQFAGSCWRLASVPNTRVLELTGPAARRHLHELPSGLAKDLGLNDEGFLQLSIAL
ncbi:bifunctional 2',3'-cyclic-nucleotide 2'-phosphodiesterase/3'-nucleotidase [Falsiruegeria mediterranea]|uniref:2',3'-cyclic-nucleotide 2'-phosphodiesterase/3'-nucleotidase n=2 Tax=Falsiruegeria TaxID=2854184 RepID=A0A2R8CD40_9RHOB|nr:bifunctional 2',3'-cyclic-nucleotide 2'-phosphodiesterase/3'-nucleotidase [Falsiruegeria mediterranea]SPJ30326.1 2',3'-cyclic-nucleotide 2'-phosphodiesterase/3'-nucleotidase [Falsiruegeria mediterranea M17]